MWRVRTISLSKVGELVARPRGEPKLAESGSEMGTSGSSGNDVMGSYARASQRSCCRATPHRTARSSELKLSTCMSRQGGGGINLLASSASHGMT